MSPQLKDNLNALARSSGMDLFGVAPAERLAGAPPGFRPADYLPEVKSVIVLGCHFPEAAALFWERTVFPYQYYGYAVINKEMGHAAFRVAKALEEAGFLALPFVPTVYPKDMDYRRQSGELSHRHAAVAAGLGEFGYSGLVLTEPFGTRNRWVSILTTAELPADPMRREQKLCDHCQKCIAICPSRALQEEFEESFELDGVQMTYVRVDKHRCHYCIMGLHPNTGGIIAEPLPERKGRLDHKTMARAVVKAFLKHPADAIVQHEMQFAIDWVDYCGRCLHVCHPNPRRLR
jgi:ferredoxin